MEELNENVTTLVRLDRSTGDGVNACEVGSETALYLSEELAEPKTERTRTELLTAPILTTLLKLSWPTTTVLLAQTAVNVAEGYYLGFLGTDALAGAALVFPVFMLMTMISGGGFGSGVASSVARAIGADRVADADALLFHAIVLAVIVGALFTLGTYWWGPQLYRALGGREGVLEAALQYSLYLFAGAIPLWVVNLQTAALRGSGNVRVPAVVIFVGAVIMIPASPILIFGLGSIPGLGIAGAGLAFGLYYCAAMFALLRYMASGRSGLTLRFTRLRADLFVDILKVAVPTTLIGVFTNLTVILVTGAVGLFGTTAIAAYGIASRLDYVMIPILFGVSAAVLTMVGINMGAGQRKRAKRIAWAGGFIGLTITGTIGAIVALFPTLWLHLFSHDAEVVRDGTIYLRLVSPAYGALGFGFVISFAAQGAGHMLWPFVGSVVRLLLAAGCGWLAVAYFGAGLGTLSAMAATSFGAYAAVCTIVMISGSVWREEKH